jgi:hypothetical protein
LKKKRPPESAGVPARSEEKTAGFPAAVYISIRQNVRESAVLSSCNTGSVSVSCKYMFKIETARSAVSFETVKLTSIFNSFFMM